MRGLVHAFAAIVGLVGAAAAARARPTGLVEAARADVEWKLAGGAPPPRHA